MEASLAGVYHVVSMYVKRKFVSVKGFGGMKVQRHSFVISELVGWRVVSYKPEKPPPHPSPAVSNELVAGRSPRSYLDGYGNR